MERPLMRLSARQRRKIQATGHNLSGIDGLSAADSYDEMRFLFSPFFGEAV
jgi:hypothetical protein